MVSITKINGHLLTTFGAKASASDGQSHKSAPIESEAEYLERPDAPSIFVARAPRPRDYAIPISWNEGATPFDRDGLVRILQVEENAQLTVVGLRQDLTEVTTTLIPKRLDINPASLVLIATAPDPVFRATTESSTSRTVTALVLDHGLVLGVTGQTTVRPKLRFQPTALRSTVTADYGWKYRRTIPITNNTDEDWVNEFVMLSLGATDAIVTAGKMQSDGDDVRIRYQGAELQRTLNNFNTGATTCWIVVPGLKAGATMTVDVVYGNASANPPTVLTFPNAPAPDIRSDNGTATAGGAATLTDSSKTFPVDGFRRGTITLWAGTGAPASKTILSNTGNQITTTTNWATPPDATSKYVIQMSDNQTWVYPQDQIGNNAGLGLWNVNSGVSAPSVDFNVPGAWKRFLMLPNRDVINQLRWTSYVDGSTFYQGRFQAIRYREGATRLGEQGLADGVSFHSSRRIVKLGADFAVTNKTKPDGTATGKFVIRYRGGGGEQWVTHFEYATIADPGPATIAFAEYTFPSPYPKHLYCGVLPADEVEIPQDAAADDSIGATSNDIWYVVLDPTEITVGAISAEVSIHDLYGFVRHNSGHSGEILPHEIIQMGGSGSSGRLAVPLTNYIEIDADARSVKEYTTAGVYVGDRTWGASFFKAIDVNGVATAISSPDWLPLDPRPNPLPNPSAATNTTGWTASAIGGVTASVARDASVYDGTEVGSFRLDVSVNPGNPAAYLAHIESSTFIPITASAPYPLLASVRTSNSNLRPILFITWYTSAQAFISTVTETLWAPGATTWYRRYYVPTAPANAAYAIVSGYAYGVTSGITGSVWFDCFCPGGHFLLYSTIDVGVAVSSLWTPGYL